MKVRRVQVLSQSPLAQIRFAICRGHGLEVNFRMFREVNLRCITNVFTSEGAADPGFAMSDDTGQGAADGQVEVPAVPVIHAARFSRGGLRDFQP